MATMKVVEVRTPRADFEVVERPIPDAGLGEILIKVEACGICHGDAVAKEGHFPGLKYPRVPGHEVVGIVASVGPGVTVWKVGQRVGVGWHGGHCGQCRACRQGHGGSCETALTTGLSTDGGYAEYMVARAEAVAAIPADLDPAKAAPLLCAGRTTFGALSSSGAQGGDLVAIHGLGGLGHLAVQYAAKLGFRTVALTRSREKGELALQLGAHAFIDTSAENAGEALQRMGGARVILATAPSGKAISDLVSGLGYQGHLMVAAFDNQPLQISPAQLMLGARTVSGWVGGDLDDTLRFSVLAQVNPVIETFPLEQAALAYEKMMNSKVHFRAVLIPGG